jgi:hypothetical protein
MGLKTKTLEASRFNGRQFTVDNLSWRRVSARAPSIEADAES